MQNYMPVGKRAVTDIEMPQRSCGVVTEIAPCETARNLRPQEIKSKSAESQATPLNRRKCSRGFERYPGQRRGPCFGLEGFAL